ncbi:hypothetical protein [Mycobacterium marinum]|uniref:hypothetical protein n=1 Tax=Mycobacterium marinum TaxID=1781 RepID=UPI00356460A1
MTLATAASAVLASYGRYKSELSSGKDRATLDEIAQSRWMFSALMGLSVVVVVVLLPSVAVAFYLLLSALMLMRPLRILTLDGRRPTADGSTIPAKTVPRPRRPGHRHRRRERSWLGWSMDPSSSTR